jgi:ABC-type transporter Mla subunit MlaD
MTNDELERIMNFIIERQEHIADQQAVSADQLAQAETLITTLASQHEETQTVMAELARRDADKEQRIARFERSYSTIAGLLEKHDDQLVALTDGLNRLTQTVERYITARGNNGSSGAQ